MATLPVPPLEERTLPDARSAQHLRSFANHLRETQETGDLRELLKVCPLLDAAGGDEETSLERDTTRLLPWLEQVCLRPKTLLRVEEERQPLHRCKHPSSRAPMTLAAHPEDWEGRTILGVRPRRVLSQLREEEPDRYENRLAVALVQRLNQALMLELREMQRILRLIKQRQDFQCVTTNSPSYRRTQRLLSLWGAALEDTAHTRRLEERLEKLRQLLRRVRTLMDTPLYRQLSQRLNGLQLRMTNLLSHDEAYRHIAELWQCLERYRLEDLHTHKTLQHTEEQLRAGIESFGLLILSHALKLLGFAQSDPAMPWTLRGLMGTACLEPIERGWRLQIDEVTIHISCFAQALETSPATLRWASQLEAPLDPTLVLHLPADLSSSRSPQPSSINLRSLVPGAPYPIFITIAPWEIESIERVGRALRWFFWGQLYKAAPPRLYNLSKDAVSLLRKQLEASKAVNFNVDPPQLLLPIPAKLQNRLEQDLKIANQKTEATQTIRDKAEKRDPHRKILTARLSAEKEHVENLSDAKFKVDKAISHLAKLTYCPCCFSNNPIESITLDIDYFRAECWECGAQWGAQVCVQCLGKVPWIQPTSTQLEALDDLDATWGLDLLSAPDGAGGWRCTCAHTPAATQAAS